MMNNQDAQEFVGTEAISELVNYYNYHHKDTFVASSLKH